MPPTSEVAHQLQGDIAPEVDAIRELAERQHGVVSRRQLLELGFSGELVKGRLANGRLIPIHRGVFAVGHAQISRRGQWLAAVLACGPGAVLSHGSAAALWAIRGSRGLPEVTRRSGGTPRAGLRLHQTRILEPAEVAAEAGIPVTSVERTLLDLATGLDSRQLERAAVAADRTGCLRWPELRRLLDRTPLRQGAGRLRGVSDRIDPRAVEARSATEIDFLALCRTAGVPVPEVNVSVCGYLVDFFWPAQRVIVETDSYTYHGDRLAFESDHERTISLAVAGYTVHRATTRMLEHDPAAFLRVVHRSLNP
jgi:hypothetical protein